MDMFLDPFEHHESTATGLNAVGIEHGKTAKQMMAEVKDQF
jgi:hypothetical protein